MIVMPTVSVIIPVYNTGKYLERCVGSVMRQTFRDIEVICVNDCSTDNSLEILRSLSENDKRVKIIDFANNQGVSRARNAALDVASGDYVSFLDSDDWIDEDYIEAMVSRAKLTGDDIIVNSHYINEYDDQSKNCFSGTFGFIDKEAGYYSSQLVQSLFPPIVFCCFYSRKYLIDNKITFPFVEGGGEDIFFSGLSYYLKERVYVFRGPLYHYFQRESSLSRQSDNAFHYIECFKLLYDEVRSRGIATEGFRLFFSGQVMVDTEDKFEFIRSFLSEIKEEVLRHSELYASIDLFLLEAVCSCGTYDEYLQKYSPNISISFIRRNLRRTPIS